jgi:hypothetical protein
MIRKGVYRYSGQIQIFKKYFLFMVVESAVPIPETWRVGCTRHLPS